MTAAGMQLCAACLLFLGATIIGGQSAGEMGGLVGAAIAMILIAIGLLVKSWGQP